MVSAVENVPGRSVAESVEPFPSVRPSV